MTSILINCICIVAVILIWLAYDAKLIHERRRANTLEQERDALAERVHGSVENYERAKVNERWIPDEREYKVALECAEKGIPRSNKQYPARFRGTR